jgi:uncharacterized repeat protein (TIGR01451 family)
VRNITCATSDAYDLISLHSKNKQKSTQNMFEKLLANVAYNPSIVHQLSFYSRRMRQESSVRRAGLLLLILAFLIQFFAVISPPQPTVADSNSDMISGGFRTAAEAKQYCVSNVRHYGDILNYYGISCADLGAGETVSIATNAKDDRGQELYSMGHLSYGDINVVTHKLTHETQVDPPGGTLYVQVHDSFYQPSKPVTALKITSSTTNKTYYALFACGNLASFGVPVPYIPPAPVPAPAPVIPIAPTPTPAPVIPAAPTPKPTPTCALDSSILQTDAKCVVCQYNASIIASDSECKPCTSLTSSENLLACLSTHKTVGNVTAGIVDANGTTAHAGDVLTYTLSAQNNGKKTIMGFVFNDNISDTLDYSDVTDLHGGQLDTSDVVSWPGVDIKGGETVTKQITIKVKDPIPATPVSASDPGHFDLTMTNVFNNAVNVKVPAPAVKVVEIQAAKLVNTGPGTGLFIAAAVMIAAGYFYSRSRLLATESSIAVRDNTIGEL